MLCSHSRITFPLTPVRRRSANPTINKGTYVVCLNCFQELPYNWLEMKVVKPAPWWKRFRFWKAQEAR